MMGFRKWVSGRGQSFFLALGLRRSGHRTFNAQRPTLNVQRPMTKQLRVANGNSLQKETHLGQGYDVASKENEGTHLKKTSFPFVQNRLKTALQNLLKASAKAGRCPISWQPMPR